MRRSIRMLAALLATGLGLVGSAAPAPAGGASPDDPVFEQGLQWNLERIGAPGAWARGTGDRTTIAIVDSGVDLRHEDLRSKVEDHVSCIDAGGSPSGCKGSGQDDDGHGTHVAGIALAATDNGRGVAGVAPDARLLAVRVLKHTCEGDGSCTATGSPDDVAAGIRWAADHGADIINLSLGGGTIQGVLGCAFCDAVEYAWSKGAIAVIAAGNDAALPAGFSDEHAIVVTATNRADARASYSSASSGLLREARWPVAAPGGEAETGDDCKTGGTPKGVLSTYWMAGQSNAYACQAGTSMAAPHVSGALAVLRSRGLAPQPAVERLLATAQDLGPPGRDDQFGFGRIDLGRAVGTAPGGTSTTASIPGTTTTQSTTTTTTLTTTTGPGSTTTTAPPLALPEVSGPAPFRPPDEPSDDDVPAWLVAIAMGAILATGAGTAASAWLLVGQGRRAV